MNRKGNKPVQQAAAKICPFHPKTPAIESYKSVSYMTIPQHSHARRQTSLLLVWLLGVLLPLYAQLQLKVQAPSQVSANQQYFQVRYTIQSDDASNFREPATSDFELLAAPGVSTYSNTINVNGRVSSSSSTTFTLTYRAKKKGKFTLPAASVQVGGKTIRSGAVTITVDGTPSSAPSAGGGASTPQPSGGQTAGSFSDKDLYVRASLDRTTVYEQEAVLLTYKFFAAPHVGLNNISLAEKPDFKGIVSQEIPIREIQPTREQIGGRTMITGVMQQYLLFPNQAGEVTVPSVTFDCQVIQQTAVEDMIDAFFNGGGRVGRTIKRTVQPMTFQVKALPQPQPADFAGGVGEFTIKGELVTPQPRANDVCTYRLTVSGKGNLRMLIAPTLPVPDGFDTFTPKTTDKTQLTASGITGEMVYEYTFVPRSMGPVTLPGISFSYFDVATQTYKTLRTEEIKMNVAKGTKSDEEYERERQNRASDIRDIHPSPEDGHTADGFWQSLSLRTILSFYLLLPLLYIGVTRALRRYQMGGASTAQGRSRKASRRARQQLKAAGDLLQKGEERTFYAAMLKALHGFLADKYGIALSEMTHERIEQALQAHATEEQRQRFMALIDTCEMAQYAPVGDAAHKEEAYRQALELMESIS